MLEPEELVDRYCEGWSDPNPRNRERLIRRALTPDAIYCDPRSGLLAVEPLLSYISLVIAARPGARVARTSHVDVHHGFGRFDWHVTLLDGTPLVTGTDFIELSAGREQLSRIVGFFNPLVTIADA